MLKIWGRTNSNNVKKALWAAEEVGVPYENIPAGGAFGIVSDPAYRTMNPNGLVPTLEDGDLVLWESNTIVRYLASQYGRSTLWIDDAAARAKAEKWMDWTTSTLAIPFRDVFWNVVRLAPDKQDHTALEKGRHNCCGLFSIVDAALASQPYLSGDKFGIGDIPLGCFAYAWFEMTIERPDLPHLAAWYARLQERPAYQKAVMIPLT
ncbi:glutathione S-transferase [Phyllobacterium brassicacearum]|uniref:Glutathione S-transferase n=1 Tax=Phyllobacterium brassicacearum TaxID=314235 RepID=A0A2P7BTF4_9HYPH|nr:glutathione S-transferase [Phyllobacterium brassicacearum]PSH69759.1 glutathione S-transferase [Phyllobacterium brassicacearum]TDQ34909.1 glutathione S-transferase [Phyllobacterium brassicacearum]